MNYIVCLHNSNFNNRIEKVMEKYIVENQKFLIITKKREIFIRKKIF